MIAWNAICGSCISELAKAKSTYHKSRTFWGRLLCRLNGTNPEKEFERLLIRAFVLCDMPQWRLDEGNWLPAFLVAIPGTKAQEALSPLGLAIPLSLAIEILKLHDLAVEQNNGFKEYELESIRASRRTLVKLVGCDFRCTY